ncbi:Zinc finger, C3HC4 type [Giardia duodenalis]|uniref:Zinc finger, C3HC4 type n=1 Tax=Giardia intestinalis TaxID=5741 RepID=V6U3X3_GIAIN|nr:Zinc finger, C3HC4 type [Giardia intestinalis]
MMTSSRVNQKEYTKIKMIALVFAALALAETIIGIDLGTTYSCVAVSRAGQVEIIPNELGARVTPSYVAFTADGERLVGDAAKNYAPISPENTIFDVKRLIGRKFDDPEVQKDMKLLPYKVINKDGRPFVQLSGTNLPKELQNKIMSPEEISAMVLTKMKTIAEDYLGEKITKAVVTVPHTSLTRSVLLPRTPAASLDLMSFASSMSLPRPLSPMGSIRRHRRRLARRRTSLSSTVVVVHTMCPSSLSTLVSSRSWQLLETHILVARTLIAVFLTIS